MLGVAAALVVPCEALAAEITVNYVRAGDGFHADAAPDPDSPAPGATLGAQRKASFEAAAANWARRLASSVPITVDALMVALPCNSSAAVLGAAGTASVHADWLPADGGEPPPLAGTWYPAALADRIAATDLSTGSEIGATFNSALDGNDTCLRGVDWHYGVTGGPAPAGTISFFTTVLHEIGHGLGVSTLTSTTSGAQFMGAPDVFSRFLVDGSLGLPWDRLSPAQRVASAIDTGDLVWGGAAVTAAAGVLDSGTSGGRVRMYAPNPVRPGSSVSHFDTALRAAGTEELMEPFATGRESVLLVDELLEDIGWGSVDGGRLCGSGRFELGECCGDVDLNGTVSIADAYLILRSTVGQAVACAADLCDVDGSGSITTADALMVMRRAVGLAIDFTCSGQSLHATKPAAPFARETY